MASPSKIIMRPYIRNKIKIKWTGDTGQAVVCLPSKCETQGSILSVPDKRIKHNE
jgi:hypothetical protein